MARFMVGMFAQGCLAHVPISGDECHLDMPACADINCCMQEGLLFWAAPGEKSPRSLRLQVFTWIQILEHEPGGINRVRNPK